LTGATEGFTGVEAGLGAGPEDGLTAGAGADSFLEGAASPRPMTFADAMEAERRRIAILEKCMSTEI
jgi:hypothetical protein